MEREREGASVKSQERKGEERESRNDRIQTLDAEDKGPNSVRGSRGGEEREGLSHPRNNLTYRQNKSAQERRREGEEDGRREGKTDR